MISATARSTTLLEELQARISAKAAYTVGSRSGMVQDPASFPAQAGFGLSTVDSTPKSKNQDRGQAEDREEM